MKRTVQEGSIVDAQTVHRLGHTRSDMTQRYAKYAKTKRLREMLEQAGF